MKLVMGVFVACAITVAAAWVEGSYSRRFVSQQSERMQSQSLERLPEQIGSWQSLGPGEELPDYVTRELRLAGSINRKYKHATTGQVVQLLLMVGQPGPLVRHPPSICYSNRAHKQIGEPTWISVNDANEFGRFQLLAYEPSGALVDERFYVAYAHSTAGQWDVPSFPRVTYGDAQQLYKAQLLATKSGASSEQAVVDGLNLFAAEFCKSFAETVVQPQ